MVRTLGIPAGKKRLVYFPTIRTREGTDWRISVGGVQSHGSDMIEKIMASSKLDTNLRPNGRALVGASSCAIELLGAHTLSCHFSWTAIYYTVLRTPHPSVPSPSVHHG